MDRESLAVEIAETGRALRRAYDQRAATLGVTRAQWRVLAALARNSGQKQVELAERLEIEPITLCRHVDRLEQAGLVERQRDPADRRAWRLVLSAKAQPLVEKLKLLALQFATEAFEHLDDREVAHVRETLARVRANLCPKAGTRKTA